MADSNGVHPDNQPAISPAAPGIPTWQDLVTFIGKQAENDRKVIDFWFKLAASILGIVLVVISFIGFKTLSDIKSAAETAARDSAKAKVEEVLKQPEIQRLVEKTAGDLFSKGVFRDQIETGVRELLPQAVTTALQR